MYVEVAEIYNENKSSIHGIVKMEKEICVSFAVAPHAKVTAIVHDKCVTMEKALNLCAEDMNRKCVPIEGSMLNQKALRLYEDCSEKDH